MQNKFLVIFFFLFALKLYSPTDTTQATSTVVLKPTVDTISAAVSKTVDIKPTTEADLALDLITSHRSFSPKFLPTEIQAEVCAVCSFPLDGITDLLKTSCGHYFHTKCLRKAEHKNGNICPMCNTKIGKIQNGMELPLELPVKPREEVKVKTKEKTKEKEKKYSEAEPDEANQDKKEITSQPSESLTYEDLPEEKKVDNCAICDILFSSVNDDFEPGEFFKTACNHYFHTDCLVQQQNNGNFSCPLCRAKIEKVTAQKPEPKDVVFDSATFEKIQLKSFIDFISDLKQMSYIPNPDAASVETSLSIREPLTADQAYNVFLSVLEMAGFAHIKVGDVYKIVKKDAKFAEPLPIFVGRPSKELPDSDKTIRFVTFLKNLSISDIDQLLKSLLSPGAQQISLPNLNGIVISDRCSNIKSAMRVINELDNAGYQEMVSLVKLKESNASEVRDFLSQLMKKPDGSAVFRLLSGAIEGGVEYFPQGIKIIADDRTNTLILLGMRHAIKRVEDFIINFVDKGLQFIESPLHIYECQYMEAASLKQIVDAVTSNTDSSASKLGGIRGGLKYFGPMSMEVDTVGNRLVISCSDKTDWNMLHKMLVDLDKPQPQVSIETLVVEIDDTDTKNLGGNVRNRTDGSPIPGVNFQTANNTTITSDTNNFVNLLTSLVSSSAPLSQGGSMIALGPVTDVWAVFQALSSRVKSSIISRPSVTISNRADSTVQIGTVSRIPAEETLAVAGSNNGFQGFQDATAQTTVKYTPQINQEGLVTLKVSIDMQDFIDGDATQKSSKNLSTTVTVADGQVMAMGGFVKTKVQETYKKTPPFCSIPILGWLFKAKNRTLTKTYTFFFVVTNIQKPRQTPGVNLYTKMKLHDAYETVNDSVEMAWGKDPIQNRFFNPDKEEYAHKVIDFANARYQPTTVDLENDTYYENTSRQSHINQKHQLTNQPDRAYSLPDKTYPAEIAQRIIREVPASGIEPSRNVSAANLEEKRIELRNLLKSELSQPQDLLSKTGTNQVPAKTATTSSVGVTSITPVISSQLVTSEHNANTDINSDTNAMVRRTMQANANNNSNQDTSLIARKKSDLLQLLNDDSLFNEFAEQSTKQTGIMAHANKEFANYLRAEPDNTHAQTLEQEPNAKRLHKKNRAQIINLLQDDNQNILVMPEENPEKNPEKNIEKSSFAGKSLRAKESFSDFLAYEETPEKSKSQDVSINNIISSNNIISKADKKALLRKLLEEDSVIAQRTNLETNPLAKSSKSKILRDLFAGDDREVAPC